MAALPPEPANGEESASNVRPDRPPVFNGAAYTSLELLLCDLRWFLIAAPGAAQPPRPGFASSAESERGPTVAGPHRDGSAGP